MKGKHCKRFKLTNNIMGFGLYGPGIDGGQNTFTEAFPELTWDKNLFVGYGEGRAQPAMKRNSFSEGPLFEPKQTSDGRYGDADWPESVVPSTGIAIRSPKQKSDRAPASSWRPYEKASCVPPDGSWIAANYDFSGRSPRG